MAFYAKLPPGGLVAAVEAELRQNEPRAAPEAEPMSTKGKSKKGYPRYVKHGDCPSGQAPAAEYQSWYAMKDRVTNPNNKAYANYGGRGISVCAKWMDSYPAFLADMGRKPSAEHTLDRIDNEGDYEPGNCRWATKREQVSNMRTSVIITHQGESLCAAEWARRTGLHINTILYRAKVGMKPGAILGIGKDQYPLSACMAVADKFTKYLRPHCYRIEIAGSIRRRCEQCSDIELLLVSKPGTDTDPGDLFGNQVERPAADMALEKLLSLGVITKRGGWGPENKFAIHVKSGIPIDFFFTTESKWWNALVVRTGPANSNKAIAAAALALGWHWHACGNGFSRGDHETFVVRQERDAFDHVGLAYLPPEKR